MAAVQHFSAYQNHHRNSPSPSPYARSISSDDINFCDPRNLTVGTVNSTLAPEFAALPTLYAGEDEDQKFGLRGATPAFSPNSTFDFTSQLCSSVSSFDSEDDFVNGLVNLGECASESSRSRASSDDFEAFGADSLLSPPDSCEDYDDCEDSDAHSNSKRRKMSEPAMTTAADSQSGSTQKQTQTQTPPTTRAAAAARPPTVTTHQSPTLVPTMLALLPRPPPAAADVSNP